MSEFNLILTRARTTKILVVLGIWNCGLRLFCRRELWASKSGLWSAKHDLRKFRDYLAPSTTCICAYVTQALVTITSGTVRQSPDSHCQAVVRKLTGSHKTVVRRQSDTYIRFVIHCPTFETKSLFSLCFSLHDKNLLRKQDASQ